MFKVGDKVKVVQPVNTPKNYSIIKRESLFDYLELVGEIKYRHHDEFLVTFNDNNGDAFFYEDELELITPKLDFSESNKRKVIDKRVKFLVDGEITDKDTFFAIASMSQHGLLLPSFVRTYEEAENLKIALNNIYEPKGIKFHIFKHESENG